jgi:HPt (histidine-containing phosphotransfer) domain-containing protein
MNTKSTLQLDLTGAREFAPEDDQLLELLQSFEQSLSTEMGVIAQGLADQDATRVEHSLHALKGFMPLFATPSLAQAVTTLYQNSRQQALDVTQKTYQTLLPDLKVLLTEVHAWPGIYDSTSKS